MAEKIAADFDCVASCEGIRLEIESYLDASSRLQLQRLAT